MKNKMKILHCCPVCNGNGLVPNGFYTQTSGDWPISSVTPETCRSCSGTGILWHDEVINEEVTKDYEILTCTGWRDQEGFKIYSVKRLSDGEVFSVGDLHTGSQFDDPREILEIIESDGEIIFYQKRGNTNLDKAKKVTRTPILTTEDGVEQIEKDYEILDVTLKHCNPTFKRSLLSPSETEMIDKIISVKRLSDGVVVSVRDKVENKNFPEHNGEVYEIEELDGEIYVYYTKNRGCDLLKDICKSRQPILTTEDGVELFEGDKHCWVDDDMHIGEDLTDKSDPAPGFKYFFTKEAAEVYRLNNARLLSVKDIAENDPNLTKATANRLRELVKSRLS